MKIGLAIRELHRSERRLARDLRGVAARHHADSDIHYLAFDLAGWSKSHLRQLSEHGKRYGLQLPPRPRTAALTGLLQPKVSEALRHRPQPALMLLADLQRIHRSAAGVSLDWELLAQAAQAARDDDLLELTARCHPQTLRQMRWANAMLKALSPQALIS